jgi:hypothetical protein
MRAFREFCVTEQRLGKPNPPLRPGQKINFLVFNYETRQEYMGSGSSALSIGRNLRTTAWAREERVGMT